MTEQVNKKKLTKSDLIKTFLLWETQTEVCLSYERLMSLGFCISMSPVINRLYDTKEERAAEVKEVEHSLNDCRSRTTQLNKQKRKYIAYLKKAEQIDLEEENENHIPRVD